MNWQKLGKVRWLIGGVAVLAGVALAVGLVKVAPAAVHGQKMESFCAGVRAHITRPELKALAEQQGYVATPGQDANGAFLKITSDDASNPLGYFCEARFKPDGEIEKMNFTAAAKAN